MSIHGRNYVIQDLDDDPSDIGASTVGLELPIGKQVKIALVMKSVYAMSALAKIARSVVLTRSIEWRKASELI